MEPSTTNIIFNTFAERVEFLMKQWGLKQDALAEKMHISQGTISSWLSGTVLMPHRGKLVQLANLFGVSVQWLQTGTDLPKINTDNRIDSLKESSEKEISPSSLYSHLSVEALQKNLADLSARLPSLSIHDRKYVLGNIRAILDELEERELTENQPDRITAITKHGIVREEHADLQGVSSEIADRAKAGAAGAALAAGLTESATPPTSPKVVSTTGNKAVPSDPVDQRSARGKVVPKTAPK